MNPPGRDDSSRKKSPAHAGPGDAANGQGAIHGQLALPLGAHGGGHEGDGGVVFHIEKGVTAQVAIARLLVGNDTGRFDLRFFGLYG